MSRHVVVTGARTGIGLEVALQFLREGEKVVLSSRSIDQLPKDNPEIRKFVDSGNAHLQEADLSTLEGCQRLLRDGLKPLDNRLDVLVNNAGRFFPVGLKDTTPEQWRETMALNLDAVFHLTKGAMPLLAETKGCIVNISSVGAHRPDPGMTSYCVSKAGVDMLTRSSAQELAGKGIRVNSINPGVVETPIALAAGMSEEGSKQFQENAAKINPLHRIGTPHDIAAATLFLADPHKAGWITGQTLVIDGGQRSFAG